MADTRKTVFITGVSIDDEVIFKLTFDSCSAPGIGYNLAQVFHERGFRVIATARKAESLADLKEKGIETLSLTVDDEESVKACHAEVCKLLDGRGLDYLVNNAGRNYTVPATDLDMEEVEYTFRVNLFAVMRINQLFFPQVQKARGVLAHVGSTAAIMPFVFGAAYNASKAALHSYCDTLRVEVAPFGVHVVTVVTGGVKSAIARTERALPADSLWTGLQDKYRARQVASQTLGQDTARYARNAVDAITRSRGWVYNANEAWLGGQASRIWVYEMIDWWTPGGFWQRVMPRYFGLPARAEMPQAAKKGYT